MGTLGRRAGYTTVIHSIWCAESRGTVQGAEKGEEGWRIKFAEAAAIDIDAHTYTRIHTQISCDTHTHMHTK